MSNSILDKRVKPGMIYTGGSGGKRTFVVTRVDEAEVTSKEIGENCEYADSHRVHWSGHGWFRPGEFTFIRQLSERDTKKIIKDRKFKLKK